MDKNGKTSRRYSAEEKVERAGFNDVALLPYDS
jgi:hypothetical protein